VVRLQRRCQTPEVIGERVNSFAACEINGLHLAETGSSQEMDAETVFSGTEIRVTESSGKMPARKKGRPYVYCGDSR